MTPVQKNYTIIIMCTKCKQRVNAGFVIGHLSGELKDFVKIILIPFLIQIYLLQQQHAFEIALAQMQKRNITQSVYEFGFSSLAGIANYQKIKCHSCEEHDKWTSITIMEENKSE